MALSSTSYGQPNGNTPCPPKIANTQRIFYAWVEQKATEEELREYLKDKSKPAMRRKFIKTYLKAESVKDFCEITNQTHGMPKATLETITPPTIKIELEE